MDSKEQKEIANSFFNEYRQEISEDILDVFLWSYIYMELIDVYFEI